MKHRYSHVEKLSLEIVHAVQRLRHYILFRHTTVIAHINPFQFVLTRRMIRREYNKWIVILQEFDHEFVSAKLKKLLVFTKLMSDLPSLDKDEIHEDLWMNISF